MWRNIGGFVAGILVAGLLVAGIEFLGIKLLKNPPAGLDSPDPAVMQAAIERLPRFSLVMVLLAFTVGAFGGSFTAALLCRDYRLVFAAAVGLLIWISTLYWLLTIPSPWILWGSLQTVPVATLIGGLSAIVWKPSPIAGVQPYDMRKKGMACK